jgi:hypothetical protein
LAATKFVDRDGVEWWVQWRDVETKSQVIGAADEVVPAGFEFVSSALTFRWPWPEATDPRALREPMLQQMVDSTLDE